MSSSVQRCSAFLNNTLRKSLQHSIGNNSTSASLNIRSRINDVTKHLIQQSRPASSHSVNTVTQARSRTVTSRDESREMMAVWPDVVRDLTDAGRHLDVPHATKWMAKVLQYNVPSGKKNRGLAVVYAFKKLATHDQLTEENVRLARILGWCVELYQAFFLVEDDIMDGATTRRGQPCWYRQNNIGLSAINDGLLLEQSIFQLLRTHFKDKACYLNLVEVFHENILKTTMGQTLDLISTHFGQKPKLELFTMDQYNAIVKYKTAYYSFVMPVSLAMYFAGITDPEMHRQAKTILLEMGHFFQVQDDFLDCYGDPEVTGKIGTDIQDGKCSWLAVVALQRATPAQKKILEECYGSSDPAKVDRVKQLYNSLGLQTTYSVYEEESYNLMNTHIQQISRGLPHDLFFKFLEKIYRRDS
ncbi:farnesyl pyrophosphate synthase isoform X1 [Neodiprion lecontei]|uniref:Farnesyl pyrophosphate synthase n=1 Tax=Neodiprion lecontei TaxID=441921 RepID=A0A6J0BEG1_NEOLC|nr:farnesyl pyrophosphate synthase isoform X1 [Neodiprion lecontei]